jgi:uncharacterized pyridoxamine 5'-phosphate oxidase family protein
VIVNTLAESKDVLRQMLRTQGFAVLGTLNNQQPYLNLVAFAVSDDLRTIIFATNRNTQKYRNILSNNMISLLVDNRSSGRSDIGEGRAITALGMAKELERNTDEKLVQSYINRHPSLVDFFEKGDTAIVNVVVTDYILARFDGADRIQVDSMF